MIMQDQATFPPKINDYDNSSLIHNLFVFNKSGVCFYGRNFTDYVKVEKNLLSPFITALMSFAKEMIGRKFKIIEMEDVKIVVFEKNSIYYGVLCDTIENLTLLDDIITKINHRITTYLIKNDVNINAQIVYDSELNEVIEGVIKKALSNEFNSKNEKKIIKYLKEIALTDDIEGIILLTDRGKVIFSTYQKSALKNFLKEVEFRVKIYNNSILKLFYTFKDRKFIFSEYILNAYFVLLVFSADIKFGLAEHYLTKIVDNVKITLSN
jgi:hypothetical protein